MSTMMLRNSSFLLIKKLKFAVSFFVLLNECIFTYVNGRDYCQQYYYHCYWTSRRRDVANCFSSCIPIVNHFIENYIYLVFIWGWHSTTISYSETFKTFVNTHMQIEITRGGILMGSFILF